MCQNPGVPVAEKVEVWLVVITSEGEEILVGKRSDVMQCSLNIWASEMKDNKKGLTGLLFYPGQHGRDGHT